MSDAEATVARLAALYEAAGPRLGCRLVEANILLVLADLRGTTNFIVFEPTDADRATITRLSITLDALGLRAWMEPESNINANGRPCSVVVFESLAGYASISRQTHMPWVTPFEAEIGWSGWEDWADQMRERLEASYPEVPEDLLLTRWVGVWLGYPDQAVEDACRWETERRDWNQLARAVIPAVVQYRGAAPIFSYDPAHVHDLGIVETIATWERLLEAVYASVWHQQLVADPLFQAARRAYEGNQHET